MQDIEFQIFDWRALDLENNRDDDNSDTEDDDPIKRRYNIKAFGMNKAGESVSVTITDFTPYFFAKSAKPLKTTQMDSLKTLLIKHLPPNLKDDIDSVKMVQRKEMVGFTNNKLFSFVKIICKNLMTMKMCAKFLTVNKGEAVSHEKKVIQIGNIKTTFKLYESNIEPYIRFIHVKKIKPCGWIRIHTYSKNLVKQTRTNCKLDVSVHWKNVVSIEDRDEITPAKIASFDIECTSSHGDFPLAKKSYEKLSRELIQYTTIVKKEKNLSPDRLTNKLKAVMLYAFNMENDIGDFDQELNPDMDPHDPEMQAYFSKIHFKKGFEMISRDEILLHAYDVYNCLTDKAISWKVPSTEIWKTDNEVDEFKKNFSPFLKQHINNSNKDLIKKMKNAKEDDDDIITSTETCLEKLNALLSSYFPPVEGDPLIQIGTTFHKYGQTECYFKHVITLGSCDDFEGVDEIVRCKTEKEVLLEWTKLIQKYDPDIITGYNIFGFDMKYMHDRADEMGCLKEFSKLSRYRDTECKLVEKKLFSSALGENTMYFMDMEGRVMIDVMKVVQRDHNLDSYKLDNVASVFLQGKVLRFGECDGIETRNIIQVDNVSGINPLSCINIKCKNGDSVKVKVLDVNHETKWVTLSEDMDMEPTNWGLAKDDITPNEIFKCQDGSSADRAKIAKYCVQDCALCNLIIIKLETIANNVGMSNVCYVPLSYIFMRGQGVKIFSLVSRQCRQDNILLPVLKQFDPDDESQEEVGYEGAIVLTPTPGVYVNEPISVMDYASLYPSSMISENISHDSIVLEKKYDNIPGVEYVDITYDVFEGNGDKKKKNGEKICRFAQFPNNDKGVLPRILQQLLKQRKATKKRATEKKVTTTDGDVYIGFEINPPEEENTYELQQNDETLVFDCEDVLKVEDAHNDFMKAVLDGLQLAYKVTANSLYGQVGARTSPVYLKELAASTTATGRDLILKAKKFMEEEYDAEIVYGDTDSIFVNFRLNEKEKISGKEALQKSIDLSIKASKAFNKAHLKEPHDLEYEKTFFPFIILSKKRYVGNLYEHNVNKYKQKSMGIVLKRRDNANIVKYIYGGMIDIILNECNVNKAVSFLKSSLDKLIKGGFPLEELIITKTLKGEYKDPTKIAHRVLADRMGERDPGSKPMVNDRIPYVYVITKGKNLLQGDKIEDPSYIRENNLKPDYTFYISNQLMKPVSQLLSVVLEQIDGYLHKNDPTYFKRKEKSLIESKNGDLKKVSDKMNSLMIEEVEKLIFRPIIKKLEAKKDGNGDLTSWLIKNPK
jgi:DNA polymerase elongation subunit (family B)